MGKGMIRVGALALVLALLACGLPALAAGQPYMRTWTMFAGQKGWVAGIMNAPQGAKAVSLKSSNSKVLRAELKGSALTDMMLYPLKAGTAKVTAKYRYRGRVTTLQAVYTVKAAPNALSELSVNGRRVSLRRNRFACAFKKFTDTRITVTYKVGKGWKQTGLYAAYFDPNGDKQFHSIRFKSGRRFRIPKGADCFIYIYLQNAAKDTLFYSIAFTR